MAFCQFAHLQACTLCVFRSSHAISERQGSFGHTNKARSTVLGHKTLVLRCVWLTGSSVSFVMQFLTPPAHHLNRFSPPNFGRDLTNILLKEVSPASLLKNQFSLELPQLWTPTSCLPSRAGSTTPAMLLLRGRLPSSICSH